MQPAWPTRQCVVLSREAQALSDNCWISPGSQLRSATTGCTASCRLHNSQSWFPLLAMGIIMVPASCDCVRIHEVINAPQCPARCERLGTLSSSYVHL